jgi:ethanolaminephosphotransferase
MIGSRITRRWNQTGQKWAGEPDIAKTFFSEHRIILWVLVGSTYLWNLQVSSRLGFPRFPQWAAATISTAIVTAAVTFKLAFTHEDSPELLSGFAKRMADNGIGGALLVSRARIAFAAVGLAMLYTIISGFGQAKPNRKLDSFLLLKVIKAFLSNIGSPLTIPRKPASNPQPPNPFPHHPISRNQHPPPPPL